MPTSRLAHAFVHVRDLERTVAFYAAVFRMRRSNSPDTKLVKMRAESGADIVLQEVAQDLAIASPNKLCFETDDVAALRQAILDHGGRAEEPYEWCGAQICECADPEGNRIELFRRSADGDRYYGSW